MNQGWISIYRQIQDCEIWDSEEPFDSRSAWVYLILNANHQDKKVIFNKKPIIVKRGQLLTSVRKLSQAWHWSNNKTLRYLRLLEELQMITRDANSQRTLITLIKYGLFQGEEGKSGTRTDTRKEQQRITNNKDNNEKNVNNKAQNRFTIVNGQDYDFEDLERKLNGHT